MPGGGRRYLHITAGGFVEPCAFVHFRRPEDSILHKPLLETLQTSKLFQSMRARQETAYKGNPIKPCWIVDRPWALREVIGEVGASSSEGGSNHLLDKEVAKELDKRAKAWEPVANDIWGSIQRYNRRYEDIHNELFSNGNGDKKSEKPL